MTLNEFQELCKRTRNCEQSYTNATLNGTMGLAGEASEALELVFRHAGHLQNGVTRELLIKELGDVMWYVADYATTLHLTLGDLSKYDLQHAAEPWTNNQGAAMGFATHIVIFAGKLLEGVKKEVFHKKPPMDISCEVDLLGRIMFYVALLAATIDAKMTYVLDANVEKLRQRYPEGFKKE